MAPHQEALTLENLRQVLREEKKAKKERHEYHAAAGLRRSLNTIWDDCQKQRKPAHHHQDLDRLFRCPLSYPSTTLVPLSLIPTPVREKLGLLPSDSAGDETIVEVPRALLLTADNEIDQEGGKAAQNSTTEGRPLSANLTTKLSEYTRGMSGQARPFRPGGGVEEDSRRNTTKENAAESEEQIERSRKILELTRELLMDNNPNVRKERDKLLLQAPPNIPELKVGLSLHITGESGIQEENDKDLVQLAEASDNSRYMMEPGPVRQVTRVASSEAMFARSLYEDDSLFGSSSSGDDDAESDQGENEIDDSFSEDEEVTLDLSQVLGEDTASARDEEETEVEDLDKLLNELSLSTTEPTTKKLKKGTNPLKLAQRQAKDQLNSTRKSWASTKMLPDSETALPNPAMTFPFELDGFQKQAIARLERSESVFVAAHTSAGKTVVAEYAVALARQRSTRCVYTSPIKALSNQKFRDFSIKFGAENVGLITGDLQVNADDSTVLIMTTEILRSMLYRGADLIRDIEFVIFDEVHYINDTERGVVWEEVIVLLPSYVNLVFLSATTPNTLEFSDWIGRTKRKPVHVVKTDYRPVPLSHHLWAGNKLHKVLEGKGSFLDKGYADATKALLPTSLREGTKNKGSQQSKPQPPARRQTGSKQMAWQAQGSKQNWMSLVRFLEREMLTPSVVFSFSKKKCEEIANMLRSLDLNTAKERSAVQGFTLQTMARLSENDSQLPQVMTICEMATRGIGVHHGGLLPILKEMVEILFSRNLIKVLFATETFAMGVNMPARAVVFNSLRKHDGTQFRSLEPGEYTQMAGRAGRRGLDKVGTVIMCCFGEEPPPQQMLRTVLTGRSTTLNSQFRLTYNMILNLLRVEEISVESMIKRSFSEFATQRALTANEYPKLLARGEKTLGKMEEEVHNEANNRVGAEDISEYHAICKDLLKANSDALRCLQEGEIHAYSDLMQPGRVLLLSSSRANGFVRSPGLVLQAGSEIGSKLVCLVLLPENYIRAESDTGNPKGMIGHIFSCSQRLCQVLELGLDQVLLVSSKKQKIDAKLFFNENDAVSLSGLPAAGKSGLLGPGPRVLDDPFAGLKPAGKKSSRDEAADFFGGKPARNAPDPFAGMKAVGKKGGRDDPSDFFGGRKSAGKKGKGADEYSSFGSGAAREEKALSDATTLLIEMEQSEIRQDGIPVMELRGVLKRGNEVVEYRKLCEQIQGLITLMRSSESHAHPNLEKWFKEVDRRETLREKVSTLRHLLSNESLQLFPDFLQRKGVLRRLGYLDKNETVCVKGRVACEVNTCEELIVTEMVFEGIFNNLEPEEIAAILSALVFQEKKNDEPFDAELPLRLVDCCNEMKRIATNLGKLQKECGLKIDPQEYCDKSLKFGLVHIVYEWALGVPFKNICELSDVQEGSIVRAITRLDELCREVRNCARVVGNPTLYRKMEAASVAIKRDIVFASSLYVS